MSEEMPSTARQPFRLALANQVPVLGKLRRFLAALIASLRSVHVSYAQHGEDSVIFQALSNYDLSRSIYIDVGANHPTDISNTYLLYRHNVRGVTIEPNPELLRLHQVFRPRDIAVGVGCGQRAALGTFEIMTTPVLSRFANPNEREVAGHEAQIWQKKHVPILPLDTIMEAIDYEWICLLSIDTEGLDYEVLMGAPATSDRTLFLCVEVGDSTSQASMVSLLESLGYVIENVSGCNLIARNTHPKFDRYRLKRS